jgi:hypothetical protein
MPGLVLVAGAVLVPGCGDDEATGTPLGSGTGLRFHLPAEALNLESLRLELWNEDVVHPLGCPDAPGAGPLLLAAGEPAQIDSCTRAEIFIWDYRGRLVRHEPEVPFLGRAWGWNTEDDDGNEVPSGYYATRQPCLDSQGEFTFTGHYYLRREREQVFCEWPLWIEDMRPGPSQPTLAYDGFPLVAATSLLNPAGQKIAQAVFDNPFLVRVHAPGYAMFEQEIRFAEFEYTDVDVILTPLTDP